MRVDGAKVHYLFAYWQMFVKEMFFFLLADFPLNYFKQYENIKNYTFQLAVSPFSVKREISVSCTFVA